MSMNKKAISKLMLIILMAASAIIGGIISYMLTIVPFLDIPRGQTVLTIADVAVNPEDASSFIITVLNPSFSVSNATVKRIAVSVGDDATLYDVSETEPPLEEGIIVSKGKAVNITCSTIRVEGEEMDWGEFAYMFAGQSVVVHVFSEEDAISANRMFRLPYVKLEVTPNFEETFRNFTLELRNDKDSETALTIESVKLLEVEGSRFTNFLYKKQISLEIPELPVDLEPNQSTTLTCQLNWFGINKTDILILTEQGYKIRVKDVAIPQLYFEIKDVVFDVDHTDRFNITMVNYQESVREAIIEKVEVAVDGNITSFNLSMPIFPGWELNYTCMWDWRNYREETLNVTVFLKQDISLSFRATTPPPIIIELVDSAFDLKDKNHFNITIQNHPSSLEAVNITRIEIEQTSVILKGNLTSPGLPYAYLNSSDMLTIRCNYTWTDYAGENLTIIIHVTTKDTEESYQFNFTFTLPAAELNITSVKLLSIGMTNYLNITLLNAPYSTIPLTISKIIVTFENQTEPIAMQMVPAQQILPVGEQAFILFPIRDVPQGTVNIEVITEEGTKASWSGTLT